MNYDNFIGTDVSKAQLDIATLSQDGVFQYYTCTNNSKSISKMFWEIFKNSSLDKTKTLICAENTGHYSNILSKTMVKEGYSFWLECPNHIAKSQGLQRGKNDKEDAARIAIYASRYSDKAKLLQASNVTIEKISYLSSERDMLVKDAAKYKSQIKDHENFIEKNMYQSRTKRLELLIRALKDHIKDIESNIDVLINDDQQLKHQISLLKSVDGVGNQVALKTIIATQGFTKFDNHRQFACHVGVAPFEYRSGSSIRSAKRVSKRADRKFKSLIHMAALSAIQKTGELREYYLRKTEAGKNKMTVINAVRAKIIARMFAVIKNDTEYEHSYKIILHNP